MSTALSLRLRHCFDECFQISESWSYPPLTDTAEAASKVHQAITERGWRLRP